MKDPRKEYERALAVFSQPGNRWNAKGRLTYWGKAAGLTADEIISDARAAGVKDRDADIRRGWNDAKPKGDRSQDNWRRTLRAKPKPQPSYPRYVRDLIGDLATKDKSKWPDCRDLFLDLKCLSPWEESAAWDSDTDISGLCLHEYLTSLFDPADVLHIFRADAPTAGKPGVNLLPCSDWLAGIERGEELPGDLITANPLTGAEGETTDGKKSFVAQSCIARYPFALIEFDAMPLELQCTFWRGLLTKSPLTRSIASITYSGGKSLHGLLHVGCRTLAEWQNAREKLRRLFCADPDPTFRADEQAMRPRTGTRLPGVRRFSNGKTQRLLYLNPEAVRPTIPQDAREMPCKRRERETGKDTPEAAKRATGQILVPLCVSASVSPIPPPDDAPLDDIVAYFDVLESMA